MTFAVFRKAAAMPGSRCNVGQSRAKRVVLLLIFLASSVGFATASLAVGPPLVSYRTGEPDPALARVSPKVQQGIFTEPETYIDPLVKQLVADEQDSLRRAKIIHDWIAEHIAYDAKAYLAGERVKSAWTATLRSRKSVCQGYSDLMSQMCRRAGVECHQVYGHARGFAFSQDTALDPKLENHAWNALKIDGRWYLVDVTWDAGTVSADGFHKAFSHAYLFLQPRDFLHTHFPTDRKWQLVDRPISAEQFARLPNLKGRFFAHELRLKSQVSNLVQVGRSHKLRLQAPVDVVISAKLRNAAGETLQRQTLIQRNGEDCTIASLFPAAGRYDLSLFCKRRGDSESLLLAATFALKASNATERIFPQNVQYLSRATRRARTSLAIAA